jgi:hypothetical protein
MSTRRPPYRLAKSRAQVKLLNPRRRRGTNVTTTAAGGQIDKATLDQWVSNIMMNRGPIIDVYIQQICHYVIQTRGLIAPNRAMLMQRQTFYTTITPPGGGVAGSQLLPDAGITAAEFIKLDYFFHAN